MGPYLSELSLEESVDTVNPAVRVVMDKWSRCSRVGMVELTECTDELSYTLLTTPFEDIKFLSRLT